jgi:hypothetical protein
MQEYFKSEADKIIFGLLYADVKTRMKLLNITEDIYNDEQKLETWYADIKEVLDNSSSKRVEDAKQELLMFYLRIRIQQGD